MREEYLLVACLAYLGAILLFYAAIWARWGWKRRGSWGAWSKRGLHG